jgi:NAD(P)H-flavin reductase
VTDTAAQTRLAEPMQARLAEPMLPRPFVVRHVKRETTDTATLSLAALDGTPSVFAPGQFTVIGRPGWGEVPISISGDPARHDQLEHTVRAVGDASRALVTARPGDTLLLRGPYGVGWDVADGTGGNIVIVAGGIGLAPLRPALLEVLAHRPRYRRVFLVYGTRAPHELLFARQLERWRGRFDVEVDVTVDAATPEWRGHVGLVTSVLPRAALDPDETLALVCGPEIMMRITAEALVARGLRADRIKVSLERSMKCGVGVCGHCQLRELFVCLDGPVFRYDRVAALMTAREL